MRARRAALDTLAAVAERDAYANLVLPGLLRSRGLSGMEAARATDLAYGTLRGLGTYDRIIDACATRGLGSIDQPVLDALRMGTYQLLTRHTPAHAAVSTTVDLVRQRSGAGASRFANAVLRQVAERDLDGWVDAVVGPAGDERERLALRHLHPRWIVDVLAASLASDAASGVAGDVDRLAAVLAAHNEPPHVCLAALPGRCSIDELVEHGATRGRWADTAATAPPGDPHHLPAVAEGRARVQDEGSQLVALAMTTADVGMDERAWLDMCAGPGGKATLLAAVAAQRGTRVLTADVHRHRAGLVRSALVGAGLSDVAAVVQSDGTRPAWRSGGFDRVLLDAPCTGLGALRRRPEARWRRSPDDVDQLVPLQRRLLGSALDSVRVGGVVGYVTCSPHLAETVGVVESVVAERRDVVVEDAPALVAHVPGASRGRFVQLWADLHRTDAMFLAVLRRTPTLG